MLQRFLYYMMSKKFNLEYKFKVYFLIFFKHKMDINKNSSKDLPQKLPGDNTLPYSQVKIDALKKLERNHYRYSVADYFKKPKQSAFKFSPNGKYIAYRQRGKSAKKHLYIKNISTKKSTCILLEGKELIRDYGWASDKRILYIKDKGGDENYQLFALDLDGKNKKALTPFAKIKVRILELLKEDNHHIIIEMNKENEQIFEPYKLNVHTGKLKKLFNNTDPLNPISSYDFDKDGNLKAFTKQQSGVDYVLYYRLNNKMSFEAHIKTSWRDEFYIIDFDYNAHHNNIAFVMSNLESDTSEIVRYDFSTKQVTEKIYCHKDFDMSGLSLSRKRGYEVDYYMYVGEKKQIIPVSTTYQKLQARFCAHFGEDEFSIASATDNEDKYLLYVNNDRCYGSYCLYDVCLDKFELVFDLMPQLKEKDMAKMQPINFKTRDGVKLYGYLTLPHRVNKNDKIPLIINPHGGPYGVRDYWGFNPEAQLFASRGYASLQINYRGSGGYGKTFFLKGSKQIGRKMLDDLEDGVHYALSLGMINSHKIAIYGASYGGLATLGSLVKTPDLYACGVDYVGVSNLFTLFKSFPAYWKPYLRQIYEQWYDENNPKEREIIATISPALNTEHIKKPLFVAQGANDPRVNINESDQIVKQLRQRGISVPYMVKYNEGHGFTHEENRIEFYACMMGFFAKYLKN